MRNGIKWLKEKRKVCACIPYRERLVSRTQKRDACPPSAPQTRCSVGVQGPASHASRMAPLSEKKSGGGEHIVNKGTSFVVIDHVSLDH